MRSRFSCLPALRLPDYRVGSSLGSSIIVSQDNTKRFHQEESVYPSKARGRRLQLHTLLEVFESGSGRLPRQPVRMMAGENRHHA